MGMLLCSSDLNKRPRGDSNAHARLRRPPLYPLSYGGMLEIHLLPFLANCYPIPIPTSVDKGSCNGLHLLPLQLQKVSTQVFRRMLSNVLYTKFSPHNLTFFD